MALLGALCAGLNALGFTNQSLRAQESHLLGQAYTVNQMCYDLARLRLNGLIERREHTNTYLLTSDGQGRDLLHQGPRPAATTANRRRPPTGPAELRTALATIDRHVLGYLQDARLGNAA
jgi:hypothetical protein